MSDPLALEAKRKRRRGEDLDSAELEALRTYNAQAKRSHDARARAKRNDEHLDAYIDAEMTRKIDDDQLEEGIG